MQKYGLTRTDFIKYQDYFFKMLEEAGVQDSNINRGNQDKSVNQKHDKSFKDILKYPTEMAKFLEQFIKIEVDSEDLEEQKNNYINKEFERRESDIIYKIKDKEIYILVEHQSKVDNSMPRRMFEYCMMIMMAIENRKKLNREYDGTNPIIIPVVIYTGADKWTVKTKFSDTQKNYKGYGEYKINLNYKLIDVNKFGKEELKKNNTRLSNMMILEKCKIREEFKEELIGLILLAKSAQDNEMIEWIKQQIKYVFCERLGSDGEKILDILERGEMNDMEDLFERMEANERKLRQKLINKGRREGKIEGKIEGRADGIASGILETITAMIKNMLKYNEDDETIMRYTNAKQEDIDRVRKELGIQA